MQFAYTCLTKVIQLSFCHLNIYSQVVVIVDLGKILWSSFGVLFTIINLDRFSNFFYV